MSLNRSITTVELIQIQRMFSFNRGYKDLIRDFKKDFGVELDKATAKQFIQNRSWREVLKWLTGDDIDTKDLDNIPAIERKQYDLLLQMLKLNKLDEQERQQDIEEFMKHDYFIPECVKYFNLPLYGEIITYKFKEPFLKCFLLDAKTHKISKIEDVPVSNELPNFLLNIIKVINRSMIATAIKQKVLDNPLTHIAEDDVKITQGQLLNICSCDFFKKYNICVKD